MKKLLSYLLTVLVFLSTSAVAYADSEITVTGTGEILIPADVAVVTLGVSAVDRDVLKAQAKVNETIADIREALIAGGVHEEDINTDYINIYAVYDYSGGTEELTAYNANSTLAIRISDVERVGEVIDTAFENGANTLNGINFSATDTSEAEEKALKAAVKDAREKASVIAEASDLQLKGIRSITEQGSYTADRGNGKIFAAEASADGAATVVQAAKLTVSSSVTITFLADVD